MVHRSNPTALPIPEGHTFGGRLRARPREDPFAEVELTFTRLAFVYQRLSTTEQQKNSQYSLERQDGLAKLARQDGYPENLIYVERRDLGRSGTLGQEGRPGLAHLISLIEAGRVESIYVIEISRISRDQSLIDGLAFGEVCRAHDVKIITPLMRYNLRNEVHLRLYRYEIESAAEELKTLKRRMVGARDLKARQGYHAGGRAPTGYIVDRARTLPDGSLNPNYEKFRVYEPHARVVRRLFELMAEPGATPKKALRRCREEGLALPPFPPELGGSSGNGNVFSRTMREPDGSIRLSCGHIESIVRNPAYLGWWVWGGEVVKRDNHAPIVDEHLFWEAQSCFTPRRRPTMRGKKQLLSGLLYCGRHDPPRRMISSHRAGASVYFCRDDDEREICHMLSAHILERPLSEFLLSQCRFGSFAQEILERLDAEQSQADLRAGANRKAAAALQREIDNLRANLALTRVPEQVTLILVMMDERMAALKELSAQGTIVVAPTVSRAEAESIREFLEKVSPVVWEEMDTETRHQIMTLLLERVTIFPERERLRAEVEWSTGRKHTLLIHRRFIDRRRRWTEEEDQAMRESYPARPPSELLVILPGRTWKDIRSRAKTLGLRRVARPRALSTRRCWSPEEDEVLHAFFRSELSYPELFDRLPGRTYDAISFRARRRMGYRFSHLRPVARWELVDR